MQPPAKASSDAPASLKPSPDTRESYPLAALLYGLAMVLILLVAHRLEATDYVGADNDDVMRLIEVRDLLGGQGWFDMTQYRLGLEGGTLMHWSRFIDLPIALLIRLFGHFASSERAEQLALAVWPLSLAFSIVLLTGLAAFRAGGRMALHVASIMTIIYVYGMGRFGVGSIDHHNAQLTLATLVLAMLVDPERRMVSFGIAGCAAAMGIAIGAESAPFVAASCLIMGALWGFHGAALSRPVAAFSLSFVATVSTAFFLTVPPEHYRLVTCDNLSLGFYALASIGGFLLALQSLLLGQFSRRLRFAALGATGVVLAIAARLIAPECLGNPLASLDPMLTELWLNKVIEARSFLAQLHAQPSTAGGFYAVGFIALMVCSGRIWRGERVELYLLLLPLVGVSFAVSLVQVRGSMFSNLLVILPMALLVADLRRWQSRKPDSIGRALALFASVLASVPLFWSIAGLAAAQGLKGLAAQIAADAHPAGPACASRQALAPLETLPPGVVMAPSEVGVHILRYTRHRVLSAPYHRDQGGMLTELNAGLSRPDEAIAFLRGAKVDYLVFCAGEVQTRSLVAMKPDGLYAALSAGRIPAYLEAVAGGAGKGISIFRVDRR
nr:hypothetical protein [uncultured Gellertiella sp.]